ncbi:MAG TPA: FAD-dependent oxidoreductase [Humisphaera sp.]|jgi:hypothetical protein|nr:FAD-dependent oxidoreductase [Humisphaera sp.]
MNGDLCIYGGTAAGVIAAVTAAKLGRTVLLVEPSRHLGGMTTGGLGFTDIGNKLAIGGLSREFYRRVGKVYGKEESWVFEPSVAEKVLHELIAEANAGGEKIKVLLNHRIEEVDARDALIRRIMLARASNADATIVEEHIPAEAASFIDCTYEGDLMALAKVQFTFGREAVAQYDEPLNGIRPNTPKHQFLVPVDPYVKSGDRSSGLLPLIQEGDGGTPGAGDQRVQTYNLRLCLSKDKSNQNPITPPEGYDPATYEILARHLEGLVDAKKPINLGMLLKIDLMPNNKTDINNNGAVSTDYIGHSWTYPSADFATRHRIWQEHVAYTHGLLHFLATSPRVPASVRKEMAVWGLTKDEFQETGGWPHQLYVREARRMIGRYVVTQHDCEHKTSVDDSIGLAAYNMDSHNCQRIVQNGVVRNEGDVQVAPAAPYSISYRAITPKAEVCRNLLVPVCLSASHIAYGSIRMEPVFMLLGQSAAMAAHMSLEKRANVQDVDIPALQARLLTDGQILKWTAPVKK